MVNMRRWSVYIQSIAYKLFFCGKTRLSPCKLSSGASTLTTASQYTYTRPSKRSAPRTLSTARICHPPIGLLLHGECASHVLLTMCMLNYVFLGVVGHVPAWFGCTGTSIAPLTPFNTSDCTIDNLFCWYLKSYRWLRRVLNIRYVLNITSTQVEKIFLLAWCDASPGQVSVSTTYVK